MQNNQNSDNIVLKLDGNLQAEAEAALQEAEITLTTAPEPEKATRDVTAAALDDSMLTDDERRIVADFMEKIDIKNSNLVLQYGSEAQKKMADFSQGALDNVRTKDLGEIGESITSLVVQLRGFSADEEQQRGLMGFFKKSRDKLASMNTKYQTVEINVEKIVSILEGHQVQLFKDIAMLDKLYERNLINFKELTMYIIAGKKRLVRERETTLPALVEKARKSGLPEDTQAANDFAAVCDRFEKKLYDLELSRMVAIQMAPQIRLVQNNDSLMAEKIQSTIVNTIPLWKSQMVLALGLAHSQQAIDAQREVTNMTNELLRKNAEALKLGTIETAKASERGVVDIETLQNTNQTLISTLDEVLRIQDEGRKKRREAEAELGRLEGELRQKLLEIRN